MFTPGRITDIDVRKPLTPAEVARVEASMDAHAVTVLPGQDINDTQQLAFSRNFGPLEEGANSGARDSELRLPVVFADVSNLDKDGKIAQRETKKRMAALGNRRRGVSAREHDWGPSVQASQSQQRFSKP